ncbi:MAG: 16S rRNA (guanine(527)-N(7))-methyltransferase RsmG [Clostridia bacterium]|nr:16S rRNA (guanine(527)-N(7))-methyltransferase RsmG [Clostridia bacterium]
MNAEIIRARLTECGLACDAAQAEALCRYHALLLDWNTRMDLTAVTDEQDMLDRHYVDSLLPLAVPGLIPETGSLIDVGTGAGFPGMPLAIFRPGLRVTLLDAQQKRLSFLRAVADELGLDNITLLHARAEDAARDPACRERFDLATARAVAAVPVLAEYLLPFVSPGGLALCWKGPALAEELPQGRRAALILGGRVEEAIPCAFPGRDWQHSLLPIRKTTPTPKKYPRKAGTPGREPLGSTIAYKPMDKMRQ